MLAICVLTQTGVPARRTIQAQRTSRFPSQHASLLLETGIHVCLVCTKYIEIETTNMQVVNPSARLSQDRWSSVGSRKEEKTCLEIEPEDIVRAILSSMASLMLDSEYGS